MVVPLRSNCAASRSDACPLSPMADDEICPPEIALLGSCRPPHVERDARTSDTTQRIIQADHQRA